MNEQNWEKKMIDAVSRKLGAEVILRCWSRNSKTGCDTPVFDVPSALKNKAEQLGLCVQ